MMAGLLVTSILSGQLISKYGRYKPFPIAGTALMVVALYLLSGVGVHTSTVHTAAVMLVLGLGLGMVMQVLVLAAQNAVDYRDIGVATSGSTLFRQIGGSIGVAAFGAIFTRELRQQYANLLPPGAHIPATANPAILKDLPAEVHAAVVQAFSAALHPLFQVAAIVSVIAFALTLLLQEVPLRDHRGEAAVAAAEPTAVPAGD
jgi:MFS family permease